MAGLLPKSERLPRLWITPEAPHSHHDRTNGPTVSNLHFTMLKMEKLHCCTDLVYPEPMATDRSESHRLVFERSVSWCVSGFILCIRSDLSQNSYLHSSERIRIYPEPVPSLPLHGFVYLNVLLILSIRDSGAHMDMTSKIQSHVNLYHKLPNGRYARRLRPACFVRAAPLTPKRAQ